jgi:hypothetical protein
MQATERRVASNTAVQQATASMGQAKASRVEADVVLQAPPGYRASLLVRSTTNSGSPDGDGTVTYIWWLSVGRFQAQSISIPFKHGGESVIRVDVPEDVSFDAEVVQDAVVRCLKGEGTLPPDAVIIVK